MHRVAGFAIAVIALLGAAACGVPGAPRDSQPRAVEARVWPPPPAEPRVRYVRSFSGPSDLGVAKPVLTRLYEALVGRSDDHFVRPTGVAERDGAFYVADPGAPALWIVDTKNNRYVKVDEADGMPLRAPVAVAVRADGAVFVADAAIGKVLLFARDGKLVGIAAQGDLARPAAVAFDALRDRLYVADSAGQRVVVFRGDGARIAAWGQIGIGDGEFNYPTHLALESDGTLVVTDALNFRIQAFDPQGAFLWKFGSHGDGSGDFAAPKGIGVDSSGHVYVVDSLFDGVQIFARDGEFLLGFGERGMRAGEFWLPAGLFINARDEIFVADAYNQRVQQFEPVAATPAQPAK